MAEVNADRVEALAGGSPVHAAALRDVQYQNGLAFIFGAVDDPHGTYPQRTMSGQRTRERLSNGRVLAEAVKRTIDPLEEAAVAAGQPVVAFPGVAGEPNLGHQRAPAAPPPASDRHRAKARRPLRRAS